MKQRIKGSTQCPFCTGLRPSWESNLAVHRPDLAIEWHPTKNGLLRASDVARTTARVVWWQCASDVSHEWQASCNSRVCQETGCPQCHPVHASLQELGLYAELATILELRPLGAVLSFGKVRWRPDAIIDSVHTIVEFDGSYWHAKPVTISRDLRNTRLALEAGWRVIRVREDPLPLLTPQDVAVPRTAGRKEVANAVLTRIVEIAPQAIDCVVEDLLEYVDGSQTIGDELLATLLAANPKGTHPRWHAREKRKAALAEGRSRIDTRTADSLTLGSCTS